MIWNTAAKLGGLEQTIDPHIFGEKTKCLKKSQRFDLGVLTSTVPTVTITIGHANHTVIGHTVYHTVIIYGHRAYHTVIGHIIDHTIRSSVTQTILFSSLNFSQSSRIPSSAPLRLRTRRVWRWMPVSEGKSRSEVLHTLKFADIKSRDVIK